MATSFKNVGVRQEDAKNNVLSRNVSKTPIGIKTPLELHTTGTELLVMNTDLASQIKDNLKNLILTNHGERIVQYSFGANLRPLLTEFSNREFFDQEAMLNINTAIRKFMPFITPVDFEAKPVRSQDPNGVGLINIIITYAIPLLKLSGEVIEVDLYII